MRFQSAIYLFGLVILFGGLIDRAWGQDQTADELYRLANRAYEQGHYQKAIRRYRQILALGIENGYVYYNLGNSYFKDNRLGWAILAYERARRLLPRDEDVRANLLYANSLTLDKLTGGEHWRITRWVLGAHRFFSVTETTLMASAGYSLLALLIIVLLFLERLRWRRRLLYGMVFVGLIFLTTTISTAAKVYTLSYGKEAIVVASKVDARSGPGTEYERLFTLHEGAKVKIQDKRGTWRLIKLPDGTGGWIEGEGVEPISWLTGKEK